MGKRIIGSFSFDVTKRILEALEISGPTKRTNLATRTGLNYNVCLRYIEMLKLLEWIEVDTTSEKDDHVSITSLGRRISNKLLDSFTVNTVAQNVESEDSGKKITTSLPKEERRILPKLEEGEQVSRLAPSIGRGENHKVIAATTTTTTTNSMSTTTMPEQTNPPAPLRRPSNIMLVDDEPDVVLTYKYFLESEGYSVTAFSDAYNALRGFAENPSFYDLVILDIRMPELNGLQLYQSLKTMNPSCKIIFMSALSVGPELVSILPGITLDNVVRKPVDKRSFTKKITEIYNKV